MIDVKMAVQIAKEKAAEMLDLPLIGLEEIEREIYKDRDVWSITLSFPRNESLMPGSVRYATDPLQYKRFLIDADTGELVAMKLREVAYP
jgi:hypothetical protein